MANPNTDTTMSRPASSITSPRPMRSRTQSISSDRPSTIAHSLMSPPLSVSPEAVFIAASAASQIVTNDHDSHADTWYDQHGIEPAGETALVSAEALQLVNSFLDQLLFNFLQGSRATTLAALRPAVTDVLKPKLAKDAVNNADEELHEYLGGGDEDDFVQPQGGNPSRDWDLELVWKRTRLRCMVYSSLGDMEEEDEDLYMEQENLELGADESVSDVISPAVAIFLTSVLEYMGELTLTVAGQAAYHRLRVKHEKEIKDGSRIPADIADRIVVEEADMERVALDRTLGRLWRGWKKRIRSPAIDGGRPFSRASIGHLRHDSNLTDGFPLSRTATHSDIDIEAKKGEDHEEKAIAEKPQPSEIALPLGDNDVDEIEVPGLAAYSDEEAETEDEEEAIEESKGRRPKSLLILPIGVANDLPTPTLSQPHTPILGHRKRSNSLPTPGNSPYRSSTRRPKEISSIAKTVADDEDAKMESSTEESEEIDPAEDPTPKATSQNKRLSKIMTTTPAGLAMTGITAAAQANASGTDEVARYEKAEIMTSARVSVAGSSSPALSDSGGPFSLKRSSSVHSARIIDVTGPKSPTGSRSPSLETIDRVRPVSVTLSRTSSLSNRSNNEESRMPKVLENLVTATATVPKSRSPVDRMRGSISNAATISESEEEVEVDYSKDQKKAHRNATFQPSPLPASVPEDARSSRGVSQSYAGLNSQHHPPAHSHSPSNTKVTILRTSISNGSYHEDQLPEIPRKAAGHSSRHTSRSDKVPTSPTHSIGMVSVERTKTRESDEDTAVASTAGFAPRPIHTSGSSASSGTSRLKAVRTSEENASTRSNVARNFEELIQSNQTITYTLTPENMRDIDSKRSLDSPLVPKGSRRSDDPRSHNRSRSSSAATELKGSPNHRLAGMSPRSIDKGAGSRSSPKRGPIAQARDARVPSESTADFAEFIKSTGPTGDNRPTALRNINGPPTPAKTSLDSRRVSSNSTRLRYQPREAATDRAGNSDLIDFIRQGPPSAANNRIPKTVAPFMDDEISGGGGGVAGGRAVDATIPDIRYSQASTHGTDTSMPSMQSSVNSHTALLKSKGGSMPTSKMFDDDDMMPKRKTRRVRDPYAIDFSDEDDDDFITTATPKPPIKKEESLAEFLRNYEPPPEPVSVPISHKIPKKKASAPSLIGRFTRSSTSHSNTGSISQSPAGTDSRSLSSRSGGIRGYIPIQVSMPSGYGAKDSKPSRPPMPVSAASAGRVPMKRFEPREAVSNVTRTSDLAAFLRNSEPPPEPVVHQPPPQQEGSSLSKMFSRRKKSSMA